MAKAASNSDMPAEGKQAPAFTLEADDGTKVQLASFKGDKNVVLYFYPKDDTPGCTKEACAFRDDFLKFKRKDTVVLGVSPDPVPKHVKFKGKYDLNFPLLSDPDTKIAQKYGVWVEKNMYGRKY